LGLISGRLEIVEHRKIERRVRTGFRHPDPPQKVGPS
jgi:hypothetical protein